jgi:Flp pilus assembly protein TadD/peroxiredoxin
MKPPARLIYIAYPADLFPSRRRANVNCTVTNTAGAGIRRFQRVLVATAIALAWLILRVGYCKGQLEAVLKMGNSWPGKERCPISLPNRSASATDPGTGTTATGQDSEQYAEALNARLQELSAWLRDNPIRTAEISALLATDFRSSRLRPRQERILGTGELQVFRAEFNSEHELDRETFPGEFAAFVHDYQKIIVAEFNIVDLAAEAGEDPIVRTTVDYDLVGNGRGAWRLERNGCWKIDWKRDNDGKWAAVSWVALDQTRSQAREPVFVDDSYSALGHNSSSILQLRQGVGYWQSVMDEALGIDVFGNNGIAAGDIDGDGLDDFYVCQPSGLPNRLYHNLGNGTFTDVTETAGVDVLDPSSMALFSDMDNDGDQDLTVITWKQPLLFVNDGSGKFTQRDNAFHFEELPRGTFTGASVADFDRDGYLDLYLCSYSYFLGESSYQLPTPYHDANNGPPNVLFRNDGKGHFAEVTRATGVDQNNRRFSFACAWTDYNHDGWPDLYVANDFGRNNLYRNNGRVGDRVTFTDVAAEAGVEDIGAGMSVAWSDYNNDGLIDLYVGNMGSPAGQRATQDAGFLATFPPDMLRLYRRHAEGNSLFRNRGDGTFEEVTSAVRAQKGRWAWSCDSLDFDSNGWDDLYITNGFVTNPSTKDLSSFFWRQVVLKSPLTASPNRSYEEGWRTINRLIRENGSLSGHERNIFLRNDGTGAFDDASGAVGLDIDQDGRAFAAADYDTDGDPDVLLKSRSGPQLQFYRNDFRTKNVSVSFRLVGRKSNRDAVGARVTVQTDSTCQTKTLQAGSGFLSQHSKELLFGLGKANQIRQVLIEWPSGLRQILHSIPIDHRIRVEEGNDNFQTEPFRPRNYNGSPSSETSQSLPSPSYTGTWLYEPFPAPDFSLNDVAGRKHRLSDYRGRSVLINFWARSCLTSVNQLKAFRENLDRANGVGAVLLAISLDNANDFKGVEKFVHEQGLNFTALIANQAVIENYNILNKYLFSKHEDLQIPTSFLVDGDGMVIKVYRGVAEMAQILSDLGQMRPGTEQRLSRALPFPGRYYVPPPGRDYFQFGIAFAEAGLIYPALDAFREAVRRSPSSAEAHYNLGTLNMRSNDLQSAQNAFEHALELKTNYPEAHNNLGMLLAKKGRLQEAIAHFESALALRPDYAVALNNLGHAHMQAGDTEKAEEILHKALKLQPDFPEVLNNLGILYGNRGDLERAKSHFEKVVKLRSNYPEAVNNLAMVYAAMGLRDEALRILKTDLERSPDFEPTYLNLGQIYLQAGQKEQCISILRDLLRRNPGQREAQRILRQVEAGIH